MSELMDVVLPKSMTDPERPAAVHFSMLERFLQMHKTPEHSGDTVGKIVRRTLLELLGEQEQDARVRSQDGAQWESVSRCKLRNL